MTQRFASKFKKLIKPKLLGFVIYLIKLRKVDRSHMGTQTYSELWWNPWLKISLHNRKTFRKTTQNQEFTQIHILAITNPAFQSIYNGILSFSKILDRKNEKMVDNRRYPNVTDFARITDRSGKWRTLFHSAKVCSLTLNTKVWTR